MSRIDFGQEICSSKIGLFLTFFNRLPQIPNSYRSEIKKLEKRKQKNVHSPFVETSKNNVGVIKREIATR